MLGSPKYMSPEQVTGLSMDHRSDIFTLGVLLYEMVSGVAPFSGSDFTQLIYHVVHTPIKPLSGVIPGLPEMLDEIVDRALAKEPIARYQNASQLAADLRACKAQLADSESSRSSFGSTSRMDHRTTTQSNRIVRQAYETATTIRTGRGIESQTTTRRTIELPHERELRLAQEEEARVALEKRINEGWTWVARYALGMVVVTVLGAVIGDLSLFKRASWHCYGIWH
jgi:serine/threonine protein kinase